MKIRYLVLAWYLLLLSSCDSTYDKLEYYEYENTKTPFLGILDYDNELFEYDTYFSIFLKDTSVIQNGKSFMRNKSMFGYSDEPKSNTFKIFDLSMLPGQVDTMRIELESKSGDTKVFKFAVRCDDLITDYEGQEVRKIIIEDYFGYQPDFPDGTISYYDLVTFVTTKNGVIGSYLQYIYEDKYIYLVPRGDILKSVYDYSLLEERVFK